MNTVRAIARSTLILFVGQIITIVLSYLCTVFTARHLGAEGFGILSFAIAFTGVSCLLSDLGLSVLITREMSRNYSLAGKYIGNVLVIKIILTVLTLGFTAVVVNPLVYPFQTTIVVYFITLATILASFKNVFYSIFQVLQKMEYITIGNIIYSVLLLAGTIIAINRNLEITLFASVYFLASLISLGYSIYICSGKFVIPKIEFDLPFWKNLLKESIPFWMTSVFVVIYFKMDMVMLSMVKGDEAVGWYAAAYRLIDGLSFIPAVLMTVMFPIFSSCYVDSKASLELAFEKSLKFLTIVAIPIGVGTTILADEIIMIFYGSEYMPSATALKILIWANVLCFIDWTPSTLLNSTNRQRPFMVFTFIGAILNLVLNYILIPSWSYQGAGIATVITELVVGLLMLSYIQKTHNLLALLIDVISRSLISAVVMGIFVWIFKDYMLILLVPLAAIFYFCSLVMINGVGKDDLKILNQALKDKSG